MDRMKFFVRNWLPEAPRRWVSQRLGRALRFHGRYATWNDARAASSGYEHADILARADKATRAVVAGRALYEQDTVLFHRPSPPFQVLFGLVRAALRHAGRLNVVDYGGALGSLYYRCRPYLPEPMHIAWTVVEQPHIAAHGQKHFSSDELQFINSIDACMTHPEESTVLLSGVLQYLEHPFELLDSLTLRRYDSIIIDRTAVSDRGKTELTVQLVPPQIYVASYPTWIFDPDALLIPLKGHYRIVVEFASSDGCIRSNGLTACYRGLIAERNLDSQK